MENQTNIKNQNTQHINEKPLCRSEQEGKVKYPFYDPRSTNSNSTLFFALELLFGISIFAIIYSFFFGISLPELINNPYDHINILILTVLSLVVIIVVYAVITEGFHKCTVPIPLSYRINTIVMMAEIIFMIYLSLRNNPYWSLFFTLSLIHVTVFYKVYGSLIKKIDSQKLGEKMAEEYYSVATQGLRFSNLYFLIIPLINVVEIYIGRLILGVMPYGGVYFPLLLVIISIQDLFVLVIFFRKRSKN